MHSSQTSTIGHNFTQKSVIFQHKPSSSDHYLDILIYYELFKSMEWLVPAIYNSTVIYKTPPQTPLSPSSTS